MGSWEDKLDQLSPQKRALYELMLKEKRQQATPAAGDSARRRSGPALFCSATSVVPSINWNPGSSVYNLPRVFRLEGPLEAGRPWSGAWRR